MYVYFVLCIVYTCIYIINMYVYKYIYIYSMYIYVYNYSIYISMASTWKASPPFSPAISKASGLALAPEADIQAPHVKSWESKGPILRWESKGPIPRQIRPSYRDCWEWLRGGYPYNCHDEGFIAGCSGNPRFKDLKGPFYLELSNLLCKPLCQVTAPLPNSKYPDNCNVKGREKLTRTLTDIPATYWHTQHLQSTVLSRLTRNAKEGTRRHTQETFHLQIQGKLPKMEPPDPKNNGKVRLPSFWGEARFVVGVGVVQSVGNLEQLALRYQKLRT